MITGRQIRAARGLLDWDATMLAEKAGLTRETVSRIETDAVQAQEKTIARILAAFDSHGIEFIGNTGVQIRQGSVYALEGIDGFKKFMDDVYTAACDPSAVNGSKPICISNVDDSLFMKYLGDYMTLHVKRMDDLEKVKVRILVREQDSYEIPSSYIEYRRGAKSTGNVPFYVYGDKLAILMLDESQKLQIIVISSPMVAKAYREQFELLWQMAETQAEIPEVAQ